MFTPSSSIFSRGSGLPRARNSCGRLRFSTSSPARGGGPLFNLGGLGASREAQYLSKERGIPRTEYSANIHLIRSSEVDPFAPAPGSTRAAGRAAARAEEAARAKDAARAERARGRSHLASGAPSVGAPSFGVAPGLPAHDSVSSLVAQLQALRDELAETKRGLRRVQARGDRSGPSVASQLLSTAIIVALIFFIAKDVSERVSTGPSSPADGLVQAQTLAGEVDEARAQRQRDAPAEERALAESGLTSFESEPVASGDRPRGSSVLSGLFWART